MNNPNIVQNNSEIHRKNKVRREWRKFFAGVLFASPVIVGILLFTYYPAVQSLYYSFTNYDMFTQQDFIWFDNYVMIFTLDPDTWKVISNTLIYAVVSVPLNLVLGFLLAQAANFKLKGITAYRTLFYLPVIIPSVASGLLFMDMFQVGPSGILNNILKTVGLPEQTWFSSTKTSLASFIFMNVWNVGGGMIIWLSCFKQIPATLYEAAELDGANAWHKLFNITIPMSTPIIFYNLITGIIGSLQVSSSLIVGGSDGKGLDNSLYFIAVKIYNEAFKSMSMGYASAFAWVLFLFIALLTIVIFKRSKWVFYGGED